MFSLHQQFEQLYNIEWYFPEDKLSDVEQRLYVTFRKDHDHYKLQEVKYTYLDIVTGLKDVDVEFVKKGNRMKITLLNI